MITRALDRAGRRFWQLADGDPDIIHQRTSRPFQHYDPPQGTEAFVKMITSRANEVHEEYIHRIKGDLRIDPRSGFIIRDRFKLIVPSLPNAENAGRPSIAAWAMARARLVPTLKIPRCISLRDVFETNYFHFFNEVLTRIPLLQQAGVLDAPIVVGHGMFISPFFQSILPKLTSAGLMVIDQGHAFVECEEMIYCKSIPFDRQLYDQVMDLLDVRGPDRTSTGRKVFLTRGKGARNKRTLSNWEEVHELMIGRGFEIHDPAILTLDEQIELLSGTRHLIGIHGAGLTNLIFRRGAPMDLLEIFPSDHVPPHYYWLSQMYGHGYRSFMAGNTSPKGTFEIPIPELKRALDSFT